MTTVLPPLDLNNVQGDILQGLAKKYQSFYFFRIDTSNISCFSTQLASFIPLITTVTGAQGFHQSIVDAKKAAEKAGKKAPLLDLVGVNISFSKKGLDALNITEDIGDGPFKAGQFHTADTKLGDSKSTWDDAFKGHIHGVILVAANSKVVHDHALNKIKRIFQVGKAQAGIIEVKTLEGNVRPGLEDGHEHFGFNDGLSQPAIDGVTAQVQPGQKSVPQGIALVGRDGDNGDVPVGEANGPGITRPSWALDGSFLAFRYLKQLVPEFNSFLELHALKVPTPQLPGDPSGAELLGARLVGRWKSGAPIDSTPIRDDPALATPEHNQDFQFDPASQERCPFAAHLRKTNPRDDLVDKTNNVDFVTPHRVLRRGIPFGPEVTHAEKTANKSSNDPALERGLLFACYQSNITNGFEFLQQTWANNIGFPPQKPVTPGIDAIIGEGPARLTAGIAGTDPNGASEKPLPLTADWVIPRGGEYFFSPSISTLKSKFAQAQKVAPAEL